MSSSKPDLSLKSPRILCLHGGGVTGEAFRLQARALIAKLQPTFRLVFADGPFFCDPGTPYPLLPTVPSPPLLFYTHVIGRVSADDGV